MAHKRLVAAGSFCWNKECQDYGKVNQGNIRCSGKTRKGVQRFQCKTCKGTFTETKGTLFYRRHTPQETILDCLAMVAERNSLAAVHRVKDVKEETLLDVLREAAQHVEEIEALLLANYRLTCVQLEALWTYVGHKGEKGGTQRKTSMALSSVASR